MSSAKRLPSHFPWSCLILQQQTVEYRQWPCPGEGVFPLFIVHRFGRQGLRRDKLLARRAFFEEELVGTRMVTTDDR